jgi:hypothetical protein
MTFYDHLLDYAALEAELEAFLPEQRHRLEIIDLFDATIHHVILDVVFEHLPTAHHELFIMRFWEDPSHHGHMSFLCQHVPDIEERLRTAVESSRRQFIDTIHA